METQIKTGLVQIMYVRAGGDLWRRMILEMST